MSGNQRITSRHCAAPPPLISTEAGSTCATFMLCTSSRSRGSSKMLAVVFADSAITQVHAKNFQSSVDLRCGRSAESSEASRRRWCQPDKPRRLANESSPKSISSRRIFTFLRQPTPPARVENHSGRKFAPYRALPIPGAVAGSARASQVEAFHRWPEVRGFKRSHFWRNDWQAPEADQHKTFRSSPSPSGHHYRNSG